MHAAQNNSLNLFTFYHSPFCSEFFPIPFIYLGNEKGDFSGFYKVLTRKKIKQQQQRFIARYLAQWFIY